MYICIYVYMYICIYVCMYVCIYVYMYICINVYMYICIYVYMYICIRIRVGICICICIFIFVYMCIKIGLCVYAYIYSFKQCLTNIKHYRNGTSGRPGHKTFETRCTRGYSRGAIIGFKACARKDMPQQSSSSSLFVKPEFQVPIQGPR